MLAQHQGPVLSLHPRQSVAFNSYATEILYGGSAGAGKSHLLRAGPIAWCSMIPGLKVGLFRRLFPDLVANHLEGPGSFYALLAPWIDSGHVAIVKGEIRFWNGALIKLHHCQHEKDVIKYQGAEFHVLLFDELTHFTEYQYRYIRGRLRSSDDLKIPPHIKRLFPRIVSGSNPGNLGHNWVKEAFVEQGEMVIKRMIDEEGGMLRQFVPGRLSDNPSLVIGDPGYVKRLMGLGDPVLVRALLDGDWDIAAGAMYAAVWRKDRHICAPFAIPIDWTIWMGADDGYAAPASCHWLTQNPRTKTIYVIAELYQAEMLPDVYADEIKRISRNINRLPDETDATRIEKHGPEPFRGLLDSAAFADTGTGTKGQGEISRGKQLVKAGIRFKPTEKWQGSRVHRAQNLAKLLGPNKLDPDIANASYWPAIRFFSTCKMAIKTIASIPRDPDNIEDVDTDAEDHAYDSVTYGLQMKFTRTGTREVGV